MTTSDTFIQPDYTALEQAPVAPDPFPHVVVPHFIRSEDLGRLFAHRPHIVSGGSFPPDSLQLGLEPPPVAASTAGKAQTSGRKPKKRQGATAIGARRGWV